MEETRVIAQLPGLEIEIRHRQLAEQGAKQLAISTTATPSFEAVGALLQRHLALSSWPAVTSWPATAPWLVWLQLWQSTWISWLRLAAPASSVPDQTTEKRPRER